MLSTILEALLVGWALALLSRRITTTGASQRLGILTTAIVFAGVIAATALVFFTATGEAIPH